MLTKDDAQRLIEDAAGRPRSFRNAAVSILRNLADAEDEMQNALLAAWQHSKELESAGSFPAWFQRIVTNQCLMRLRSRRRRPELSLNQLIEHSGFQPKAEDQHARRETRNTLRQHARMLPPLYRNVITLYLAGMEPREVRARLGISPAALKSRTRRAYAQMRMNWTTN